MSDKKWIMLTYLFYCIAILFFTFGCPMYAVFVLGFDPLWMLLTIWSGFSFPPHKWYSLMDGVNRPTLEPKDAK